MFHTLLRSVVAGQEIFVLMEEVMQGWSLARIDAVKEDETPRMGLIPREHYTFTSNLELSPQVIANTPPIKSVPLAPLDGTIDLASQDQPLQGTSALAPIEPQLTGAPFRRIRGKSFNRFSSFVTSGTEEWINHGSAHDLAPSSSTDARRNASDDSQTGEEAYTYDRPEAFYVEVRYVHI